MNMYAMPECEQGQKNGCHGVSRPWGFAVLMLCVLLLLPAFAQPILAGPPGCPSYQLFGAGDAGSGSVLYAIDPSTGAESFINPISSGSSGFFRISAIDFHPTTGVLYAVGTPFTIEGAVYFVLLTIDPCTGSGTQVALLDYDGPITSFAGQAITDMSFNPINGALYVYWKIPLTTDIVATVNLATGVLSNISITLPIPDLSSTSGNGLAFSGLSLVCCPAPLPTLYRGFGGGLSRVNYISGGTITFLSAFTWPSALTCAASPGCRPNSMDYQPETNTLFASVYDGSGTNFLTTINTTTRVVTSVGPLATHVDAIAFYPFLDTDVDGILDSADNCPTDYNPTQADFDGDGVGDACDKCKKVANSGQEDTDGDLLGNACDVNVSEAIIPPPASAPGAPKWTTATFTNTTGTAINTIQPDCINTLFTVNPSGSPNAILPPTYRHRAYGVPDDVVTIPANSSFTVTCDVNEMFDPSVLSAGTYDVKATYSNDIDPNNNLFVGAVQSTPGALIVTGTPVTKTTATVLYDPSAWSTQWVGTGSPSPIKADINLVTGSACDGIDIGQPIMMNGVASGLYTGGVTGAPAHAIASFSGSQAVQSLGTTSPGTYFPTVQGTCSNGALFTAKAPITLGLTVSIDIKPGSGTNPISIGSRGVVPVAILSSATFDATKVLPGSITLAGGTVKLKGKGLSTYQYSISDVDGDLRPDMVVQVETTTMTLDPSMTSAVLEGLYVQDLGNGNTKNVPIYGVDNVTIVP